jgi:hypothetical protein
VFLVLNLNDLPELFFTQPDEVEMSDDSSEENVADLHQCKGILTCIYAVISLSYVT